MRKYSDYMTRARRYRNTAPMELDRRIYILDCMIAEVEGRPNFMKGQGGVKRPYQPPFPPDDDDIPPSDGESLYV